ncbi:MAG: BrnA antitoxin family protein [Chromatiales bacterium]|nr:BrnA antitoxin family protein [Chromatiales bacterium]
MKRNGTSQRKRTGKRRAVANPEWTDATFARARPAAEVLPTIIGKPAAERLLRLRGRPPTGRARVAISLRLPPETLARWKATGPGWQTRMAEVLDKAV